MTQAGYSGRLTQLINLKNSKETSYSFMGLIDRMSGKGHSLQKEIYILEGEIKCLKWVMGFTSII